MRKNNRTWVAMLFCALFACVAMSGCGRIPSDLVSDVMAMAEDAAAAADEDYSQEGNDDASQEDNEDASQEDSDDSDPATAEETEEAPEKAIRHAFGETWGSDEMQVTVDGVERGPGSTKATISNSNSDKYEMITVRFSVTNTADEPIFTDTRPFFSFFKAQDPDAYSVSMVLFNAGNSPFGSPIEPGETRALEIPYMMEKGDDPATLKFMVYPQPFANTIPSIGDATAIEGWHYVMMEE